MVPLTVLVEKLRLILEVAELFSPMSPPARLPVSLTVPVEEESLTVEAPIARPMSPPTRPVPLETPLAWAWLMMPPSLRPTSWPTSRAPLMSAAVRVRLLMLPPMTVPKRPTAFAEGVAITSELIV